MIISVFKNGYIALGEDHSYTPPVTENGETTPAKGHPDCLFSREVQFNENLQSIRYDFESEDIIIENLPPPPLKTPSQIRREIGDTIVEKAFEGNPHAQLADLVGAVLGLAYLLAQSHGKANVKAVLSPLLGSLEAASDVREEMGLSRFDASFLD